MVWVCETRVNTTECESAVGYLYSGGAEDKLNAYMTPEQHPNHSRLTDTRMYFSFRKIRYISVIQDW